MQPPAAATLITVVGGSGARSGWWRATAPARCDASPPHPGPDSRCGSPRRFGTVSGPGRAGPARSARRGHPAVASDPRGRLLEPPAMHAERREEVLSCSKSRGVRPRPGASAPGSAVDVDQDGNRRWCRAGPANWFRGVRRQTPAAHSRRRPERPRRASCFSQTCLSGHHHAARIQCHWLRAFTERISAGQRPTEVFEVGGIVPGSAAVLGADPSCDVQYGESRGWRRTRTSAHRGVDHQDHHSTGQPTAMTRPTTRDGAAAAAAAVAELPRSLASWSAAPRLVAPRMLSCRGWWLRD